MKVQFDRYIPLAISNLLLEEDECASEWFQNPTGACAITLESRPEQPSLLRFKNGNVYIGEVNQGMLDGQGKLEMVTGVVYEGKFKENLIHGEGKVDWPDSSSYEGSFKLGLKHGKGIYRNPRKGVTYEGEWVEGKREGKGTLTLKDGSVYEGEFKSGLKEGKGKLVYPSGNFYDGSWKQGKKQGEGTMKWQKDGQRYKGNWTSDRPNGQGDLIWLEQNGLNKIFRNRYSGNFENNQRSGLGKFFYANGAIYEGEWKGNIKHGYGIYYNEDGVPTYGYYQNDKLVRKLKDLEGLVGHFCPERKIKINGFKTEEDEREGNIYSRELSPMLNSSKSLTTKNVNKMLNQEDKIKDTKTEASVSQTPRRKSKAPQSNNQSKAVESIKTEEQKLALENHNEGEGNELKDDLSTSEESEALVNPYDTYLYIDDFIPIEKRDKAQKQLSEVFFRNHSQLRAWYKSYCKKNQDKYEEGFFMDSGIFFEMLDEMRLCNGRLNRESLTQMLLTYEERDFQLHFENKFVESKIKLMKRFDEEGEDYESFKTKGPEEEKKLEFELLLQEYQIFGEKKINRLSEKKPYLYKYFVNALLRAFYLKTGSITKLGPMLEKSFRTRIQPILNEKIRPKNIIVEEENIIQRSKDHVIQFKPQLEQIYKLLKSKSTSLRLSGSLTFINLILLLEVKKSIFFIFQKAGYLKYSSVEDKKHVWMVLERRYDPEESMFKILKKIESRGGKSHYTIEKLIIKHYKAKLESSISCFEEFVDTFMVLFCKIVTQYPPLIIFRTRLTQNTPHLNEN